MFIKKLIFYNVISMIVITGVCGCSKPPPEAPRVIPVDYPSKIIVINGENKAEVIGRWGKAKEVYKNSFGEYKDIFYHFSHFPPFDELWLYPGVDPHENERGVFFNKGIVVYCIEDGSDF